MTRQLAEPCSEFMCSIPGTYSRGAAWQNHGSQGDLHPYSDHCFLKRVKGRSAQVILTGERPPAGQLHVPHRLGRSRPAG